MRRAALHRLAWFAMLWLAGVGALTVVVLTIRFVVG